MDINLKKTENNNDNNEGAGENKVPNKFIRFSLATVLIILIFAIVSVGSYIPIRNSYFPVKDNAKNYIESTDFVRNLSRMTRGLQGAIRQTDDWYDNRYVNMESVKYQIINRTTEDLNGEVGNTETVVKRKPLSNLSNMTDVTESTLEKEIRDSLFYMRVKFDGNGVPEIESSLENRFNKDMFTRYLNYENSEEYANLDILYIVPQDFEKYNDVFTNDMKDYYVSPDYLTLILIIGAISILLLIIAAFAVPYKIQDKMAICRGFNKMLLELKLFAWALFLGVFFITGININTYSYYRGSLLTNIIYDVHPYFYAIGIPITFILYLLIYLNIVYIKHIYHIGFKKGVIDNSLIGKILIECKKILKTITAIDLREDNDRKLLAIIGINLLAILSLGSNGFLGFILAVAYSLLIFKYSLKILEKAKILNEASSEVAEGNFNINVDEDMGILSSMAKNLNNIKEGFRLAVDEEIKSERMKGELITNVSHDLRTPLTSIISYVDLLKDENIDVNTQKEYIDILDKKSQRLKILIEDLFEASKAHSGNIDFDFEDLDIVALFKQTLGELEEKIGKSTLQFKTNVPENKVICNLDGRRTYRVFENIMTNILKYSMENSRVYIDIAEDEDEVSFIFKNISAYEMNFDADQITDRFTRGDDARSTEGSGLGLSIAKSLVELQNGSLDIAIDGDLFKLIIIFPKVG